MSRRSNIYPGQRIGKIEILYEIERPKINKGKYRWWKCKCECSQEIDLPTHRLMKLKLGCSKCYNKWRRLKYVGGISGRLFARIKKGSRKTGHRARELEFTITKEYLWNIFIQQNAKCKISGADITLPTNAKDYNYSASLDRIDSSKGYIEGNVQWVHKKINIMKQSMTDKELIEWCNIISSFNKKG